MGDCTSSQAKKQSFYPHQLQDINKSVEPTYLILPKDYNEFIATYGQSLRQKFKQLYIFKSKQQLQKYNDEIKNNVLAIFCSNTVQLKEYQSLKNIRVFDKIILIATFKITEKNAQKQREERRKQYRFRFHKLLEWNNDINLIVTQFEKAANFRNTYFCHRDAGRINRSNLVYSYIMNTQYNFEKRRFFSWLQSEGEIGMVQQLDNMSQNEAGLYLTKHIFEGNKALIKALEILKKTINPALLLHFGWFYKILSIIIKTSYYQNLEKIYRQKGQFSIWVKLQEQERAIFSKSNSQNFLFNGFTIGYLKDSKQSPPGSSKQYIKFNVSLPNMTQQAQKYQQNCRIVDQGFFIHQKRVIFNMMNYFKFQSTNIQGEYDVLYCPIARQHMLRKSQFRYSRDATLPNMRMMKLLDVYLLNRKYVNTQRDLFFSLKMFSLYKDTSQRIEKSQGSLRGTGSTLPSRSSSKYQMSQYSHCERMGQMEAQIGNYDQAIERYDEISDKKRGLTLKQLYFYSQIDNKKEEFIDNQGQIQKLFAEKSVLKDPKSFIHFTIKVLSAKMKIINNSLSEASKCCNESMSQYSNHYNSIFKIQGQKNKHLNEDERMYSDSIRLTFLYILILQIQSEIASIKGQVTQAELLKREHDQLTEALDGIHIKKIMDD